MTGTSKIPGDSCLARSPKGLDVSALLQGRYEVERLPSDFSAERAVPDYAFNVLNPLGLLYRPVVNEQHLALGGQKPVWPELITATAT